MPENPPNTSNVKNNAPAQRNRFSNRRKTGDRFERGNYSFGNDGEKSQFPSSRNIPVIDHGETGSTNLNGNPQPGLIPLEGCSTSEVVQIMNERWTVAMQSLHDPSIDLSERPVMYSGASGLAWGHTKLPSQMDFLSELRRQMRTVNASMMTNSADHS